MRKNIGTSIFYACGKAHVSSSKTKTSLIILFEQPKRASVFSGQLLLTVILRTLVSMEQSMEAEKHENRPAKQPGNSAGGSGV